MAHNNLRIIFQNLTDISTLTASSVLGTGTPVSNLQKDIKSYVHKTSISSTNSIGVNYSLTFPNQLIGGENSGIGVILAFTNLTAASTIRVRGFTGDPPTVGTGTAPTVGTPGTEQFDSGIQLAAPYQNIGFSAWDSDTFLYPNLTYKNKTVYARVWVPIHTPVNCTSILIEITDSNPTKAIEVSRLIVGKYWSPKFNTSYGLSTSIKDTSTNVRSEAGDLISNTGVRSSSLTFPLNWLTKDDRTTFSKLLKSVGTSKPIFISLFPNCVEDLDREQQHQIYGKVVQIPGIEYAYQDIYTSSLEVEEV